MMEIVGKVVLKSSVVCGTQSVSTARCFLSLDLSQCFVYFCIAGSCGLYAGEAGTVD